MVARVTSLEPCKHQESVEVMFHQLKLARRLFPANFIKAVGVAPARGVLHGPVLLSREVRLDGLSRQVRHIFYEADARIASKQKVFSNPAYVKHAERVDRIAKLIAKRMEEAGVIVNTNPANVWFTEKGKPVFFDILRIDLRKASARLGRKAMQDSIHFLAEHQGKGQGETWAK
ncbi:MAG: hypothetical protein JW744_01195 [Candidatus Diapherotrites archaeon]|uniref:Uncharacterized protein n=1 Tax=Candidatus Iainarchaeum sp. TaxID=3101447 RepID=A0A938YTW4_9ARCH|nr:hypothetical protein [Candidatus Diapherotrites archaeon]